MAGVVLLVLCLVSQPHAALAFGHISGTPSFRSPARPASMRSASVGKHGGNTIRTASPSLQGKTSPLRLRGGAQAVSMNAGLAGLLVKGVLGSSVGFVLGLLGGGGSILALPIFLYVFEEPSSTAIAESLLVVAIGAGVGVLAKLDSVNFSELTPLAAFAMLGSAMTARIAPGIPGIVRLGIFSIFALFSAVSMLQSARDTPGEVTAKEQQQAPPTQNENMEDTDSASTDMEPLAVGTANTVIGSDKVTLYSVLFGVGSLTSIIGAGGGFVIVPVLTSFARMEMKPAVGSSLLIICLNSLVGFASFFGVVPINFDIVLPFAGAVAGGALLGNSFSNSVPQNTVKKIFASTILIFGTALIATKLPPLLSSLL